jgi:hypothetical protein
VEMIRGIVSLIRQILNLFFNNYEFKFF